MEMVDNIVYRIDDPKMAHRHYAPYILRTMNRIYKRLNRESRCLVKQLPMDFSTLDTLVSYWSLPSDWIEPFRMEPHRDFLDPSEFVFPGESQGELAGSFTMSGNRMYFADIAADDVYTAHYWSSGYTLVDKETADLETGEVNAPEWPWVDLHDLLYYATCIEISKTYPHYKEDVQIVRDMTDALKAAGYHQQSITPNITGGFRQYTGRRDAYGAY